MLVHILAKRSQWEPLWVEVDYGLVVAKAVDDQFTIGFEPGHP